MLTPPPAAAADVYCRAYRAGLDWGRVLRWAGVARSTWWRIVNGKDYRASTVEKLGQAVDAILASEGATPDPGSAPAIEKEATAHGAEGR